MLIRKGIDSYSSTATITATSTRRDEWQTVTPLCKHFCGEKGEGPGGSIPPKMISWGDLALSMTARHPRVPGLEIK